MIPIGAARAGVVSGGDAIPDSVTDQWRMDEGSGTAVANNIGTVDLSLDGATWDADADSVGGQRTDYDGTNDAAISDSAFSIHQTQMTALCWVTVDQFSGDFVISSTANRGSSSSPDAGWRIDSQGSPNSFRFAHRDSTASETFQPVATLDNSGAGYSTGVRYLLAMAMDGDSADCYVFDNNGLIESATGTGDRETGFDQELYIADRVARDFPQDCKIDAPALARGTQLTQNQIDGYRSATSP